MRLALISDIHANLTALEAVLADIERRHVDQIICLGDVAALGPQPREVLARLKALNCPCVMGNHDPFSPELSPLWDVIDWCVSQLSEDDLDFLHSFQPTIEVPLDAHTTLLCFHGSPLSFTDQITSTTPDEELERMLGGHTATIMAGGHTHVQLLRQHRGALIINPGSVGMPFEKVRIHGGPRIFPWAEYAILDWTAGALGVELRRLPIDFDAFQRAVYDAMPHPAEWLTAWVPPNELQQSGRLR